ncbi:TonB-dependent hemoglobin/transferrin/lactoferrin family receptor [Stenotrophomonas cyclobalanopsidis]|uniref:TonB-dependent hemoglobin/transferrin/lactoferrin family receptor n=1 Tax=Stenotrophomonas cyclobalanopsidis TaxID=2771362 RepID=A0ABQ6T2Y0_9GAMM|nr:TonB-dependent hemoglobin/transferrin/lactoferrin family receptor [Stenotrophomonas cyclobalanopsidis]KAA9001496.1 TonB-dependent hemoglobin/transferrin/lactoferrin family receptor [Stenotrophomonas cyclobalanopsidis]
MKLQPSLLALAVATSLAVPALARAAALEADSTLDTIQVTETRKKSDNQNVTTLSAKNLQQQGAQSMEDAIRYVPGVEMVDLGRAGFNGFNIRGMEADRVSITLDGLSFPQSMDPGTYQPYEFFRSGRGSVDLEAVKTVEIIKGADAITAGSGALSGAVMFTTKDPADFLKASGNDSFGSVKYGYTGSSDENMGSLTLANRTGRFESLLVYTKRDGHETESWYDTTIDRLGPGRRTPDPVDRESDNLLFKVNFLATDTQTLGMVYERARSTNDVDNWTRSDGTGSYFFRSAEDRSDRDRYGLKYTWRADNALFDSMEATADYQKNYIQGQTNVLVANGTAATYGTRCSTTDPCSRQENRWDTQKRNRVALNFDKSVEAAGLRHDIVYGAAWQQAKIHWNSVDSRWGNDGSLFTRDTDPSLWPDTRETDLTAYVRDRVRLLDDRLSLTGGLRYDRYKYTPETSVGGNGQSGYEDDAGSVGVSKFSSPTWNLGAEFKFTDTQSLWVQGGRGFRAPGVNDMYGSAASTDYTRVSDGATVSLPDGRSNPDLDAERSLNLEMGWRFQSDRLRVGVSVFRDKYSNFIDTAQYLADEGIQYRSSRGVVSNGYTYTMPINRGDVEVKGVEAEGMWLLADDWLARVAYSYNEGTDNDGEPLASIIPAKAVGGLTYNAPSRRWSVTANVTHQQRKDPSDYGKSITNGSYGVEVVPVYAYKAREYTLLDVFGSYAITPKINLTAGVYNVFNKEYYLWNRVRTAGAGTAIFQGATSPDGIGRWSQPGRNVRFTLSYDFL